LHWLDSSRSEANKELALGHLVEAERGLKEVIDARTRQNAIFQDKSPWAKLYNFVALSDLANVQDRLNKPADAESTRLTARDLYTPYMVSLPRDNLNGLRIDLIQAGWSSVWKGHHSFLDRLWAKANAADLKEAAPLLQQLIDADNAWDNAMPEVTRMDDVIQAELTFNCPMSRPNLVTPTVHMRRWRPHAPGLNPTGARMISQRMSCRAQKQSGINLTSARWISSNLRKQPLKIITDRYRLR
jgi:hypothetical protein